MSLACWGLVVLFWDFVFHFHQLSVFRQNTLFSDTTGNLVFVSQFTRKLAFSISKAQNMAFNPPASSNCNFSSVLNAESLFPAPKKSNLWHDVDSFRNHLHVLQKKGGNMDYAELEDVTRSSKLS